MEDEMTATVEAPYETSWASSTPVFTVDAAILKDAIAWISRGLPKRPPSPTTAGVKISARDGEVTLSCFDYSISVTAQAEASVDSPGETIINGRILTDIASNLPAKPVTIDATGQQVTITAGRSRYALNAMPLEEYPALPMAPGVIGSAEGQRFAGAIGRVATYTGTEGGLAGLHVQFGSQLRMTATDKYRVGVESMPWQPTLDDASVDAVLRAETFMPLIKALGSAGHIQIGHSAEMLSLSAPGRSATIGLMEGGIPAERLHSTIATAVNQEHDSVTFDAEELRDAVRRVRVADRDQNGKIYLTLQGDTCTLGAVSSSAEQAAEQVDIDGGPDDYRLVFSPARLAETLGTIATARVRFGLQESSSKPVTVQPVSSDGETIEEYTALLMPVKTS